MRNHCRGFVIVRPHFLRCLESGGMPPFAALSFCIDDDSVIGTDGSLDLNLPKKLMMSGKHAHVAVQNDFYFVRDHSTNGTFVRIGRGGRGVRVELFEGSTFAIGTCWFKVKAIRGDAKVNAAAIAKAKAEGTFTKERPKEEELGDDEEFASDSDDEQGSATGHLAGPAALYLVPTDKNLK